MDYLNHTSISSIIFRQTRTVKTPSTDSSKHYSIKILMVFLIGILFTVNSFGQNCNRTFVDTGGGGSYSNWEDTTRIFCPSDPSTEVVQIFFSSFDIDCSDMMTIYNGRNTSATPIGTFCGVGVSSLPSILKATNVSGCLTVRFVSGPTVVGSGWNANIICQPIPDETILDYPIQGEMTTFFGNNITADNAITDNANITFDACEITFQPGFEVELGSTIQTVIQENCANNLTISEPIYVSKKGLDNPTPKGISIFPNPFKLSTTIQFIIEKPSPIQIQLLDVTGKVLKVIVPKSNYDSGIHQVTLQNDGLQTGMYFLQLTSQEGHLVEKMLVQ